MVNYHNRMKKGREEHHQVESETYTCKFYILFYHRSTIIILGVLKTMTT